MERGGHLDPSGRPCRACTDFQSWAKLSRSEVDAAKAKKSKAEGAAKSGGQSSSSTQTAVAADEEGGAPHNCPVDKNELGRNSWTLLHSMAAYYPDKPSQDQQAGMRSFLRHFSQFYPCDVCAADLRADLEDHPPVTSNQSAFSLYMCQMHNRVNKKLGKDTFDCSLVNERWRDGWKDGSCD